MDLNLKVEYKVDGYEIYILASLHTLLKETEDRSYKHRSYWKLLTITLKMIIKRANNFVCRSFSFLGNRLLICGQIMMVYKNSLKTNKSLFVTETEKPASLCLRLRPLGSLTTGYIHLKIMKMHLQVLPL